MTRPSPILSLRSGGRHAGPDLTLAPNTQLPGDRPTPMARAEASRIINCPVATVWGTVRDFSGLPKWNPRTVRCEIEEGLTADVVGCIRALYRRDGSFLRERLLELDDCQYRLSYNFETPAFPVENYHATIALIPVSRGDGTYVNWSATFDEAPEDKGRYVELISNGVFAGGLSFLAAAMEGREREAVEIRWQGDQPAQSFNSAVIGAPCHRVWSVLADFAGKEGLYSFRGARLESGRPGQIASVRSYVMDGEAVKERLCSLNMANFQIKYRRQSEGCGDTFEKVTLYPITNTQETLLVWESNWEPEPRLQTRRLAMTAADFTAVLSEFAGRLPPAT